MDFANVDPVAVAMLTFAVVGFVKLYRSVAMVDPITGKRDWATAGTIVVAALAGAVLAPQAGEISWFVGMLIGFNASGVITAVSYFGKNS